MSQPTTFGVPLVAPASPTLYATRDDDSLDALLSGHIGASRPSYAVQGTFWNKDTGSSPLEIEFYFFDGTDDILVATFDVTANTYKTESTNIDFLQSGAGAVSRTVQNKFTETVSVTDFGAVLDDVNNDADALILALDAGVPVIIPSSGKFDLSAGQVVEFIEKLNLITPQVIIDFNLPAGDHAITTQVELTNEAMANVRIHGVISTNTTATAIAITTNLSENHEIKYTVADATNISVGEYILISGTTGTGNHEIASGCYKVTVKAGSDISVKHTLKGTFPAITLTDATVTPLQTILRWPVTERGLAVSGCNVRELTDVVIASQFNITGATPADSASDGIQIGTLADTLTTSLNESQQTNAGSMWASRIGVVEWTGNGVQVAGGNFYAPTAGFCSNGWRGCQASRNGSAIVKSTSAVGNGASGYEAEGGGSVIADAGIAAGNWEQGVYAIGGGYLQFTDGATMNNATAGIEAKNTSNIVADGANVDSNATFGLLSTASTIVFGVGATSANNTTADCAVVEGGKINGTGASSLGVLSIEDDSGSQVIEPDGILKYAAVSVVEHASAGKQSQFAITSLGDLIWTLDTAARYVMKASGIFHPSGDNTQDLGRAGNRFQEFFCGNATINTSDRHEKRDERQLDQAEKRVAMALKGYLKTYRFNAAFDEKGDDARIHTGIVAQDIITAFADEGLDATKYGMFCYDAWEAEDEELDKEGNVIIPAIEAGELHGVRYNELLCFIIGAL